MSTIPLTFALDPPSSEDLLRAEDGTGVRLTWNLLGLTLVHRPGDEVRRTYRTGFGDVEREQRLVPHTALASRNPDLKLFADRGFILRNFAEFNVFEPWVGEEPTRRAWVKLGPCEASIGDATPLMRHVFGHAVCSNDNLDGWGHSIRLLGVTAESAERRLLQALLVFRARLGADLVLAGTEEEEYPWPDEGDTDMDHEGQEVRSGPFLVADIEPLRLMWAGSSAQDWQLGFIQYYRVLEYYSLLQHADEIGRLRWDRALSAVEFVRATLAITTRDERTHLIRLVARTASQQTMAQAQTLRLVDAPDPAMLATRLYDFRNSVVHAKYDARATLHSDSILSPSEIGENWKVIARDLALDVMGVVGTPDA